MLVHYLPVVVTFSSLILDAKSLALVPTSLTLVVVAFVDPPLAVTGHPSPVAGPEITTEFVPETAVTVTESV